MLDFVKENFYIDDITASCESVEEGNLVVDTLKEVFASGCFPLKKWATASAELGKYIEGKYPETTVTYRDENFKFLGIR